MDPLFPSSSSACPNDVLGMLSGGVLEIFPYLLPIRHLSKKVEVVAQFQGKGASDGIVLELLCCEQSLWYGLPLVLELELDFGPH